MCGIAGAYQQRDGHSIVQAVTARLAHRGPDASHVREIHASGAVAQLGHRRLSIIDLTTAADQPLSKDGLHLVYNGELYNYLELRGRLAAQGVRFATRSDTEVVLEAARAWGIEALAQFRGMFALALLDERDGSLLLARDPLGIKPLYVMPRGDGLLFTSELKGLVATVGSELQVNPRAVVASMLFYFLPEQVTALTGVHKLPPGTWERWLPDGSVHRGRFWDSVAEAEAAAARPPADLATVVEESVTAHMVADVPVAAFLSGGLDSSLVTAIAARHSPAIETYTITFRPEDQRLEAMPDDAVYARRMADHLGLRLHEIEINPDVVDMLPKIVDMLDEPIGDPAAINTVLMCQAARDAGVKVLLSGMGADELFGGYRKHRACLLAARYRRLPGTLRRATSAAVDRVPVTAAGRGLRYPRWAKRFIGFAELPEEAAFRRSYTLYDPDEMAGLLAPEMSDEIGAVIDGHRAIYNATRLQDHVNRMCLTDAQVFLPGLNLTYTDRSSMSASTEVRVPFVDPEVFRAAFTFPGDTKISLREQKAPLRDAARRWVPPDILNRPKASFGAPLRAWVARDLREVIDDVLLGGHLVAAGVLNTPALLHMVGDLRAGRRDESKQLWQLLSLEMWYRNVTAAGVKGV